jgi:hypothetical protein
MPAPDFSRSSFTIPAVIVISSSFLANLQLQNAQPAMPTETLFALIELLTGTINCDASCNTLPGFIVYIRSHCRKPNPAMVTIFVD